MPKVTSYYSGYYEEILMNEQNYEWADRTGHDTEIELNSGRIVLISQPQRKGR